MINLHFISIACAIVAFVYSRLLTEPEMIFNKLYRNLEIMLPTCLFKPLIGCEKCVAGQLSFWVFFVLTIPTYYYSLELSMCYDTFCFVSKAIFLNIYFTCLSIFIVWLLNKIN